MVQASSVRTCRSRMYSKKAGTSLCRGAELGRGVGPSLRGVAGPRASTLILVLPPQPGAAPRRHPGPRWPLKAREPPSGSTGCPHRPAGARGRKARQGNRQAMSSAHAGHGLNPSPFPPGGEEGGSYWEGGCDLFDESVISDTAAWGMPKISLPRRYLPQAAGLPPLESAGRCCRPHLQLLEAQLGVHRLTQERLKFGSSCHWKRRGTQPRKQANGQSSDALAGKSGGCGVRPANDGESAGKGSDRVHP